MSLKNVYGMERPEMVLVIALITGKMVGITRGYGKTNACGREIKDKTLRSKKLVYCLRIKGRELCDSYAAAWNDLDLKRDLRKRRDQMLSDPLDIVLDVIRGET